MKRKIFSILFALVLVLNLTLAMTVSAAPAKPNKLHVGYGTIQAAVDAAQPGDTIIVHNGTYNETVIIRSDDHHLKLEGKKGAIIADDAAGSLLYGISLQAGCHDIEIKGFEITGFDEFWDAGIEGWTGSDKPDWGSGSIHDIKIHKNDIHDNYDGILMGAFDWATWSPPPWSYNNITIKGNKIYDNHRTGICLWSLSDSKVEHNKILNNGGDENGNGVFNEPADDANGNSVSDGDGMTWCWVTNLTAKNNEIHGSSEVGLSMNQSTGCTVSHNKVTGNQNLGIALFGWGAPTTGNTFSKNDARGNVAMDILCYLKWGSQVFGNTWTKNKYDDCSPVPLQ